MYILKFNRLKIICKKPYNWAPLQEGVKHYFSNQVHFKIILFLRADFTGSVWPNFTLYPKKFASKYISIKSKIRQNLCQKRTTFR